MAAKKSAKRPQEIVPLMLRLREGLRQRLAKDAEKGAKSLNAEVIDRLEASYEQAERMALFKGELEKRANESRQASLDEIKRLDRMVEDQRQEIALAKEAFNEILGKEVNLRGKVTSLEAMESLFDALIGDDPATKIATRAIAIHFAYNPHWHEKPELVSQMAQDIGDILRHAADGKPGQPFRFSAEKES